MDEIINFRRLLHAHPEISGKEEQTSRLIIKCLNKIGIKKNSRQIANHSLIAEIPGNNPGPVILFRCELDALPIEEISNLNYRSKTNGISHSCGHDGHIAIMFGFANTLYKNPPARGKVLLLFQSAEETGKGAQALLESGFLEPLNVDYTFALHVMPGYSLGSVICKEGNFTPAVESLNIELIGKTSHAAEPEKGINPAMSVARIVSFFSSIEDPDKDNPNFFLATPIQIRMGEEAFGTSPGNARVSYTFRAWDSTKLERQKHAIEKKIYEIANQETGLNVQLTWSDSFRANINHPEACRFIRKAAQLNDISIIEKQEPLKWGEDFGLFTEHYKGAMFGIGAGENYPGLHNPDFDFPDEMIQPGIKMFLSIADQILNSDN